MKQGDKQAAESGADINGRGRYDRRSDMQRSLSGRQPTGLLQLTAAFPRKSGRTNEQFRGFSPLNCGVSSTFYLKKCGKRWKIVRMNYCIFRMEKLKTSSDVCNVLKEQHRSEDYDSERADKNLSEKNSYSWDYEFARKLYDGYVPKKRRKNAVVGLMFLVTTSNEFESPQDEELYYRKAVAFIRKRFGKVVGWAIHRDETSTHMQLVTVPLVDGKLNARELVGGSKNRMREIQNSFYEEVGEPLGLLRGLEGSKAVHRTVEEKIRKEREELRKATEELQEQKEAFEKEKEALQSQKQSLIEEQATLFGVVTKATETLNSEKSNTPKTLSDAVQAFELAVTNKENELTAREEKIENTESEQILENNRLVLERQYLDSSAKAAIDMMEKGKLTEKTSAEKLFGVVKQLGQKVISLVQEVKKVLDAPLEKVEQYCREARKAGKKTLREYLFPKRELKNPRVENDKNILSKKPDKTYKGRSG